MDWIIKELATLSLGDDRLNKQACTILSQLCHNPTDSIPVACDASYWFYEYYLNRKQKKCQKAAN